MEALITDGFVVLTGDSINRDEQVPAHLTESSGKQAVSINNDKAGQAKGDKEVSEGNNSKSLRGDRLFMKKCCLCKSRHTVKHGDNRVVPVLLRNFSRRPDVQEDDVKGGVTREVVQDGLGFMRGVVGEATVRAVVNSMKCVFAHTRPPKSGAKSVVGSVGTAVSRER